MRFRGLTASFSGTLLPRGLPNRNTARPADTPRTPACPLAAAVAALLGQRGKMTDFRASPPERAIVVVFWRSTGRGGVKCVSGSDIYG